MRRTLKLSNMFPLRHVKLGTGSPNLEILPNSLVRYSNLNKTLRTRISEREEILQVDSEIHRIIIFAAILYKQLVIKISKAQGKPTSMVLLMFGRLF